LGKYARSLDAAFFDIYIEGVYTMGRLRKPTALRVLEGGKPRNKREPQPDTTIPDCPDWLLNDAKDEWNRIAPQLHRIGLLTSVDRAALAAYCQSYAKWKLADEVIKAQGLTYELYDEDGNVRCVQQRPEVGIANQCLKQIKTFCSAFGLEPSSRAKIELPNSQPADDFADKLRASIAGR